MKTITNGRLLLPDKICAGNLTFDEKIISIGAGIDGEEVIDAENNFVAAGFINIHIHGAAGVDTMDDDIAALQKLAEFLPSTGVTSFLPTTMTMPLEKIYRALERIRVGKNFTRGAKILGANVEGPFISKKFKGAQAEENIIRADFSLLENFCDVIKIITVAPEEQCVMRNAQCVMDSLFEFIDACRAENIIVSIVISRTFSTRRVIFITENPASSARLSTQARLSKSLPIMFTCTPPRRGLLPKSSRAVKLS